MTRPAEPLYAAAYREADRLAACLLLDVTQLTPREVETLDAWRELRRVTPPPEVK